MTLTNETSSHAQSSVKFGISPRGALITRFVRARDALVVVRGFIVNHLGERLVAIDSARIVNGPTLHLPTEKLRLILDGMTAAYVIDKVAKPIATDGQAESAFAIWAAEAFEAISTPLSLAQAA